MFDWNRIPGQRRRRPPSFRKMGDVPLQDRIECRHLIRQARAYIDRGFEDDLLVNDLNADGAVADLDLCISELHSVRKLLGGK